MRKRGEILDNLLVTSGYPEETVEELSFIKTAMIDRVLMNLNEEHIRKKGTALLSDTRYDEVIKKTAENVAITDILTLPTIQEKVGFIIQEIGRSL